MCKVNYIQQNALFLCQKVFHGPNFLIIVHWSKEKKLQSRSTGVKIFFLQKLLILSSFFQPNVLHIHTNSSVICMLYSREPNMHIWWRVLTFDAIFTFCDIRSCKFKCHVKVWTYLFLSLPLFSKSFWIFSPLHLTMCINK